MGFSNRAESNSSVLSNNTKVLSLDSSLQESIVKFKDLVLDFEKLQVDSENYRQKYLSVKDKCENKTCSGAEELKKIITTKDQIIRSVASTLTKLNETRNFNILSDAFKILCEETSHLTPPLEDQNNSCTHNITAAKDISPVNKSTFIKKEADTSNTADVSFDQESISEIEGTPTGRTSPIIHTKKTRSTLAKSSDFSDKKKCPDDWPTPETKAIKLIFSTPARGKSRGSGRLRQQRIDVVKLKQTTVVDLTCSPVLPPNNANGVQPLIKKESFENDDTILPSPTSGPANITFSKTTSKTSSPAKLKKPPLSLKSKSENVIKYDESKNISKDNTNTEMEESINILFANRLRNGIKKENKPAVNAEEEVPPKKEKKIPVKMEIDLPSEEDATHCETSLSLLQQIDRIEAEHMKMQCSPSKRPLAENINFMNTPPKNEVESSLSILRPEPVTAVDNLKRKIPELVEPVYKEATVRNKAEKRNLQGWSCEECKNFYGVLYKNDPVMLAKKINECSKHRGKHNPARPRTPPNFWNPRWEVPEDTEELNRMNNANYPSKRPLAENINIMNTPPKNEVESSLSILRPEPVTAVDNVKRKIPELVEPVYKEATVRNKAEKRNLQGWSCEECKNFYGVLYKNDPVMLAKKINECSKHRGKHNPARPRTPPNFWNPRWEVPEDTEELNRMNNAN